MHMLTIASWFCSTFTDTPSSYGLEVYYSSSPGLHLFVSNVGFSNLTQALRVQLYSNNANDELSVVLR